MDIEFDTKGKFDFEKLTVYQKALEFYGAIRKIRFENNPEDRILARQINRAALSISLNIAEGSGRTSPKDRRNFFVISRGSMFECVAILLAIDKQTKLNKNEFFSMYNLSLEIAKILSTMIRNLDSKIATRR